MDRSPFEIWLHVRSQPRSRSSISLDVSNDGASSCCLAKKRAGFGSSRGIHADWTVRLTISGQMAIKIWPELLPKIDTRWSKRFGDDLTLLRSGLEAIELRIDRELPQGLPGAILRLPEFAARKSITEGGLPLPVLFSRVLLAFALDFERDSRTPISLCANAIRCLSSKPIPEAEIPRRTGCSEETSGIGWQLKSYVIAEQDPGRGRGKFVRLSEIGVKAQHDYHRLAREIERK
jgi:hypothetical protein